MGSSPLARGLHLPLPFFALESRIIPARAGFTAGRGSQDRDYRDHPRSRGVYHGQFLARPGPSGSSPLARGLRMSDNGTQSGCQDHPRSRGVYEYGQPVENKRPGSSPLARGLRPGPRLRGRGPGIIPARAGFTPPGTPRLPRRRDHPRSRGVYSCGGLDSHWWHGSSPLARGLPWTWAVIT